MCHISSFIVFLKHHNTPIYNLQQILLYTAAFAASPYSLNINGKTAAVRFADGEDTLTFRKAKGTAEISGDYNTYKENKTIKVKNIKERLKAPNKTTHPANAAEKCDLSGISFVASENILRFFTPSFMP